MASSAAKVAIPSRCERPAPAPAPLWTRNFIAGTFLNFFIAGNYFMLMVVMTAYALTVYQAPAAVAAFCASAFIVSTLFSRFAAAPMMERFGRLPLLIVGCIAEVALSALYLLNEPVGALIGVRLAHGFSYGVCSTTIATVITSVVPPERKGEGIGYFMLSITLGSAIGPFAGIFLANNFGYPVVFVVASVLVALSIPAALLLRPASSTKVKGSEAAAEAEVEAAADAVRVTSDARLSVANATFYMLLDVGVGIGPILLGIVAPLIGYANLYLCMAVVGALALALFLVVAKTEKGAR